jgi:hypothetical protein
VPVFSVVLIIHTNQSFTDRALLKPALLKKGLLRGESLLGHPEGAQAPYVSHTFIMVRRPERSLGCLAIARQDKEGLLGRTKERGKRSEGCLAIAQQDKERLLGRTDGVKRDCDSKLAQLKSRKCLSATQNRDERSNHTTFQTLSLRSVIKYTKSLLLNGFSEK